MNEPISVSYSQIFYQACIRTLLEAGLITPEEKKACEKKLGLLNPAVNGGDFDDPH